MMFDAAGDEIDACGLDGGMAEDIGESHDVVAAGVKRCGKEMTQVMREHFAWCDAGDDGESFHFGPDLSTRQAFSARGEKNLAVGDFLFCGVLQKFAAKARWQKDDADLAFEMHFGATAASGFYGDVAEL